MAVSVYFSTPLLKATENNEMIQANPGTIQEINAFVCEKFPAFKDILFEENGDIKKVINIYIGDDDIRDLNGVDTEVADGAEVYFIPTIAGG